MHSEIAAVQDAYWLVARPSEQHGLTGTDHIVASDESFWAETIQHNRSSGAR